MSAKVLRCPSCGRPLSCDVAIKGEVKTVWTYCSFGPCKPSLLNDGGSGFTLEAAHDQLCQMYEDWMERQPEE